MRCKNIVWVFLLASFASALPWIAYGQDPGPLTEATVASSKYGPGGTYTTHSNRKLKVLLEGWRDKDGNAREVHVFEEKDGKPYREEWTFYLPRGIQVARISFYHDGRTRKGEWVAWDSGKKGFFLTPETARDFIAKIEEQFARDGSIVYPESPDLSEGKTEEKTTVVDPGLPPKPSPKPITIDACLIGQWTSVQVTSQFNHWTNGGENVVLTVGGDGQASIDYSNMKPNVTGDNTRVWGGTALGKLTTKSGSLAVTGGLFEVTITFIGPGQDGVAHPMRQKNGLGNLLQETNAMGAPNSYTYTCDPTTLVITGLPWSSTFKRAGTKPR